MNQYTSFIRDRRGLGFDSIGYGMEGFNQASFEPTNRISLSPVKPIRRFKARHPNELEQIDIMGGGDFPFGRGPPVDCCD